jgi:hypothetical protein
LWGDDFNHNQLGLAGIVLEMVCGLLAALTLIKIAESSELLCTVSVLRLAARVPPHDFCHARGTGTRCVSCELFHFLAMLILRMMVNGTGTMGQWFNSGFRQQPHW